MKYIKFASVTALAARLGMSDRNLQRRFLYPNNHKKHIDVKIQDDRSILIEENELIRHSPVDNASISRQLELEYRLEILENKYTELRDELARLTRHDLLRGQIGRSAYERVELPPLEENTEYASPWALPDGSLSLQDFSRKHEISRRRVLGYLQTTKNNLPHVAFPKTNRAGEYERFLTPDQQEKMLEFIKNKR